MLQPFYADMAAAFKPWGLDAEALMRAPARRLAQAVHISKSGFLFKKAKVTRTWLKRWCVVRKGVFRYCAEPGQVRSAPSVGLSLSLRPVSSRRLLCSSASLEVFAALFCW